MSHHIWCNWFMRPEEDCEMCRRLRESYPEDCSPDEMMAKHFPNVIARTAPADAPQGETVGTHYEADVSVGVQVAENVDRETLARVMINAGLSTGHGDTFNQLLDELEWQLKEQQAALSAAEELLKYEKGTVAGMVSALKLDEGGAPVNQCVHLRDAIDELHSERHSLKRQLQAAEAALSAANSAASAELTRAGVAEARLSIVTDRREEAYMEIAELRDKVTQAEAELSAYKKAKAENDERFMIEREEARAERDRAVAALNEAHLKVKVARWTIINRPLVEAHERLLELQDLLKPRGETK